jgi:glycosyltransferase involved in cell wall biosynthesis
MQIIQTIAGTQERHGGPSRSVPTLCDALKAFGQNAQLVTGISFDPSIVSRFPRDSSSVHAVKEGKYFGRWSLRHGFIEHLERLTKELSGATIIHDHGLWLPTNHVVAKFCNQHHLPRIISPRGMLSGWSLQRRRWLKQAMLWAFQWQDLKTADGFHATSEQEAADIRRMGLNQPIAVVPNGVEFPEQIPQRSPEAKRQVLFLGRIHPVKGLENLLTAWKQINPDPSWSLVLAGPDENGFAQAIRGRIASAELGESVKLIGPVNDVEKWQLYADSTLFVLPSFSENFGLSIAEAIHAGLPVITTTGTPWEELQQLKLGWWVEPTVEALSSALHEALQMDARTLAGRGIRGKQWISEKFGWHSVARQMFQFYAEIVAKNDR